ncbi:MAG: NAD(P)H-dependent glycerol-3-phosphate dehydrogenase [Verrucomicrobiales bacterium]|nr:NAD(P)H-dependent glycerol-3-phosphate dehydrogenase [Verrucomicrobiales bacterium]
MRIAVLGAGAWGTALTRMLAVGGHEVRLWDYLPETLDQIARTRRNDKFLPGIELPGTVVCEPELTAATARAELIVIAVRSSAFRTVAARLTGFTGTVLSVTKGIEYETGLTMSGILAVTVPRARVAAMSGPSFAIEVARGVPTAVVVASREAETARFIQRLFHTQAFRVYTSADLLGVELGGALKNVIAIAAGVCDGLGFGDNSKAALVTRAIAEMKRLGQACGAQPDTFTGLSGLGDLMATCFSRLSRNRAFGERLGRGEKIPDILASMTGVVEGYPTARAAYRLARDRRVETPIINEVYAMLYEGKDVRQAVRDLTARDSKAED